MSKQVAVGIKGLGVYLPKEIRTNSHWPQAIVDSWIDRLGRVLPKRDELGRTEPKCFVPG